jgi:hypothetical protein
LEIIHIFKIDGILLRRAERRSISPLEQRKVKMKKGTAGIPALLLIIMILALPGCISIEEHWAITDDQQPAPAEESSGPAGRDTEEARRQEEARRREEAEEAARREAEARENARREEEARLQREEEIRRESEAWENARLLEEAVLRDTETRENARREAEVRDNARRETEAQAQENARREAEAQENARREIEVRENARREAEAQAQENARKEEEVRLMLENLEETHRRAEAEEAARQEAERRRSSGGQTGPAPRPRYYAVQEGDTFSSIAGNPRIYNNRSEWFFLYQANRGKLENPENPDLLAPGTVIEIPSIAGEIREGTY